MPPLEVAETAPRFEDAFIDLLGDNVEGIAKELGGYGADKVMVCDSPLLKDYTTDAYAKVVCDMVNEYKPEVLLIGATNIGRDLGPRCAARLHPNSSYLWIRCGRAPEYFPLTVPHSLLDRS